MAVPKVALGYVPPQLVRISGQHRDKQYLVQYITAEEITESDEEVVKNKPRSSVFDRLQSATLKGYTSVFDMVRNNKMSKSSVFWRLKVGTQSKLQSSPGSS